MIELLRFMDLFSFNNGHGFKVLFFTGFVREPGIAQSHLQAAMAQKLLQTLQAHPGIEKLGGKGVTQAVQGIALVRKTCFFQIFNKLAPGPWCKPLSDGAGCKIIFLW